MHVSPHTCPEGRSSHDGRALLRAEDLSSCLARLFPYHNVTDRELDEAAKRLPEFIGAL